MKCLQKNCYLLAFILLIGGCKQTEIEKFNIDENDFVIAKIDSKVDVMASKLYASLLNSRLLPEGGYLDSSTYFDTLLGIVIDSVASIEAWNVKVEDNQNQYRSFKNDFLNLYVDYLFNRLIIDSIKIDSAEVNEFYLSNLDDFKRPEEFRASHLMISAEGLKFGEDSAAYREYSDDQLDSVAQVLIAKYRNMIDSTVTFGDIAFQYSMHRGSGDIQGDLGYFKKGTYAGEFEEVVCTLAVGQVSYPFKSRDGWHLAMLTDHIDSTTLPLNEVYEKAYNQLLSNQARDRSIRFIDSINYAASFEFNDSALQMPASIVPDSVWAAIVNGRDSMDFFGLDEYFYDFKRSSGFDTLTLDNAKLALKRKAGLILIKQAGDDLGYGDDSTIVEQRENLYHRYARKMIGMSSSDPNYSPSEDEIVDYYNRNIDEYIIKKPVYVQHIIVQDSIFGEFLRDQALSGVDFLELAKEHYPGAEEIRVAAADLGFIGPEEMPEEFYKTAMRTPKGTISHPVKTEWGYHIIHVVDKQLNKDLEQVRSQISGTLRKEHQTMIRNKWRQNLLDRHTIEYNLKPFKKLQLPPLSERKK